MFSLGRICLRGLIHTNKVTFSSLRTIRSRSAPVDRLRKTVNEIYIGEAVNEKKAIKKKAKMPPEPISISVMVEGDVQPTKSTTTTEQFSQPVKYTPDEEKLFDVDEILRDDALLDFRVSSFDADFLNTIGPGIRPTYNIAALADTCEVIQKLIDLGVELHRLDRKQGITEKLIQLDWRNQCEPKISFLVHDAGLLPENLSRVLGKNPSLLFLDADSLAARLDYLQNPKSWGLQKKDTGRIIERDPFWLSFTEERLENRFKFFKREFGFADKQLRSIMVKCPKLITSNLRRVILHKFSLLEQMGFEVPEMKQVVLSCPRLLTRQKETILERFNILHNIMGVDHKIIAADPKVLYCREKRLLERHGFLKALKRDQYDPTQPGFVSLVAIANTTDDIFVTEVAKSTMEEFDNYAKNN